MLFIFRFHVVLTLLLLAFLIGSLLFCLGSYLFLYLFYLLSRTFDIVLICYV